MAKFANKPRTAQVAPTVRKIENAVPDAVNMGGSRAFALTDKLKLVSLASTTMLKDGFYRTANATMVELDALINKVGPVFAAKVAHYVRHEHGMRSVSHYIAARVARLVKGEQWTKNFFRDVVRRPDDATEIMSAYISIFGRKGIPNSLKKGLGAALGKFDEYSLGKYRGENNEFKLIDLVNLVHPKPTEKNAEALKKLVKGELKSEGTWEVELTKAGQNAENAEDLALNKAGAWEDLIKNRKIAYFALLRNLRNIMQQASDKVLDAACTMLVDETMIKKSLVLPFRFLTAYKAIEGVGSAQARAKVLAAIDKAVEIALENVPQFNGKTLVALDVSGSMKSNHYHPALRDKPNADSPIEIGSLFASVLCKTNNCDLMFFDSTARYETYPLTKGVAETARDIRKRATGGATYFGPIFDTANKAYNRIIILSDMQSWVGGHTPQQQYANYCRRMKADPKIYSFDLAGLGTLQFPQQNVYALAGFSDKTLATMQQLEQNPDAVLDEIDAISFE